MSPVLPEKLLQKMNASDRAKLGKAGLLQSEADAKAAHKSEREMQSQIQAYCDLKGWPAYRSRMDKRSTGRVGTPDFLICVPVSIELETFGAFAAVECKMRGNKPSAEQETELLRIRKANGVTLVAYSAAEAIQFLKRLAGE